MLLMKTQKEIEEQIEEIRTMMQTGEISWQDYIQRYGQVVLGLEWVLYGNASKETEEPPQKKTTTHKYTRKKKDNFDRRKYMRNVWKKRRREGIKQLNVITANMKEAKPTKLTLPPANPVV
jgi:hypothetical protein